MNTRPAQGGLGPQTRRSVSLYQEGTPSTRTGVVAEFMSGLSLVVSILDSVGRILVSPARMSGTGTLDYADHGDYAVVTDWKRNLPTRVVNISPTTKTCN
jgi:hypothetical protein